MRNRESAAQPWLRVLAAPLALASGAVHLCQVGIHLEEGWAVGGFFLVVGVIQVGASALILRPRPRSWVWLGVAGTAAVIAIWVVSRTVALPIAAGGEVEQLGVADGFASLAEAWTIVILGLYLAEPIDRGRLAAYGLSAALTLGLAGLWQAAAQAGTFNADPARLAAAQPWLTDWLVTACGLAVGGGILVIGATPISSWQRGLARGFAAASVVAGAGLVWMTLPPTIGQNLDCRFGPIAAIQIGAHAPEADRVLVDAGESRYLPVFELRVCGGNRAVAVKAFQPVTVLGSGARVDGFWLLPAGSRLAANGTELLPAGAQPIPPEASLDPGQPQLLVVRLVATGAGAYTLGSVRVGYEAESPATFVFATNVAICSGACPAE